MFPILSLEALAVIEAIERKGSFAAAAASLNRVPSALSYTVQKLEQDLGVTLFQKQGRKAVLTAAGRLLVEQGRTLLVAADELAARTRQEATGWETRLRIAVDHIVPMSLLMPLLHQLYTLHDGIQISLQSEVLAGTWEALVEDRVDLVVGAVDAVPGHQGIRAQPWQSLQSVFIAAPDHPLSRAPQPLSSEQIRAYPSVVVSDTARRQPALSRGLLSAEKVLYVPDFEHKLAAHCAGLGVGTAPWFRVRERVERGELVLLETEQVLPVSTVFLGWKSSNRGKARQWLVSELAGLILA